MPDQTEKHRLFFIYLLMHVLILHFFFCKHYKRLSLNTEQVYVQRQKQNYTHSPFIEPTVFFVCCYMNVCSSSVNGITFSKVHFWQLYFQETFWVKQALLIQALPLPPRDSFHLMLSTSALVLVHPLVHSYSKRIKLDRWKEFKSVKTVIWESLPMHWQLSAKFEDHLHHYKLCTEIPGELNTDYENKRNHSKSF